MRPLMNSGALSDQAREWARVHLWLDPNLNPQMTVMALGYCDALSPAKTLVAGTTVARTRTVISSLRM